MKFKTWQRIYTLLLWLSLASLAVFVCSTIAIEGLIGSFEKWYERGIIVSVFIILPLLFIWGTKAFNLASRENRLIIKDFDSSESKDKSYYWYNTGIYRRWHHKIRILNQAKKFHELKFTPKGLFINTHWFFLLDAKEQLFLWEDIKKVVVGPNEITIKFHNINKIENKANPNNPLLVGNSYYAVNKTDSYCYMLNDIVFIKLIKTFYEGEIEEMAE
ncbi:MAG: hypothetical protein FWE36_02550 [Erysipelotrichales bacterium]|nr:hypothetical protein [Erysipelotrichales bacterium]